MKPSPILIKAIDPADLTISVHDYLEKGYDMHTPLFVNDDGLLCQFVISRPCLYEYALIIANDLDELETYVRNFVEMDFDFIFNTVMWHGKYVQWMCRMNQTGMTVRGALAKLYTNEEAPVYQHAERAEELQLVEGVRKVLRLEPMGEVSLLTMPFPVLNIS